MLDYVLQLHSAGYSRVVTMHPFVGGKCLCGNPECDAAGKHPAQSGYRSTPSWSEAKLRGMDQLGMLNHGAALVLDDSGLLVVDEDPRNGGCIAQLSEAVGVNLLDAAQYVVKTGSGGLHLWFKLPANAPELIHERDGIDYKTKGLVHIAGSPHKSGQLYEVVKGSPDLISEAPAALINYARAPERVDTPAPARTYEANEADIIDALSYIDPSLPYMDWIKLGMSIHSYSPNAFEIWYNWSQGAQKPANQRTMLNHWRGFRSSQITLGTLYYYAKCAGCELKKGMGAVADQPMPSLIKPVADLSLSTFDEYQPPVGLVADTVDFINSQCRYPRESLAVLGALITLGNLVGLHHEDELDSSANLYGICVAESSTGKEAVQSAMKELHRLAGRSMCVYGNFKSQQEIVRNLLAHQPSYYIADEIGIILSRISGSKESYLQGIIGELMSVYSKSNDFFTLSGDQTREQVERIEKRKAKLEAEKAKGATEGREMEIDIELEALEAEKEEASNGIKNPFVSICGFTTPSTFDGMLTEDNAKNGFLARSFVAVETDANPPRKRRFKKAPMPMHLESEIRRVSNMDWDKNQRFQLRGDKIKIITPDDIHDRLEDMADEFELLAEKDLDGSGLQPLARRGYEMVIKLSFIFAACRPDKTRTIEDLDWCYLYVVNSVRDRVRAVSARIENAGENERNVIGRTLLTKLSKNTGVTLGALANQMRKYNKAIIQQILEQAVREGLVRTAEVESKRKGQKAMIKYFLVER